MPIFLDASARTIVREVRELDAVPSTNTLLSSLAHKGEDGGLLVVAREQSAGRGRLFRSFFSARDAGIYMSLLLRPSPDADTLPLLTPLTGVATLEAIREVTGREVGIKWVNDIFLEGKKVSGILAESGFSKNANNSLQNGFFVVLGIGINLYPVETLPSSLAPIVGTLYESEEQYKAQGDVRDALISTLLSRLSYHLGALKSRAFLDTYRRYSTVLSRRVLVFDATDGEKRNPREAFAEAITDRAGLLVRYADGRREELTAGEISLSVSDQKTE